MRDELRYAARGLARSPLFALVAVFSLALGIGANTAVFSVVSALRFRPLPYPEAARLVDVYEHHPTEVCPGCGVGTSYIAYTELQRVRSLGASAAYRTEQVSVGFSGGAERRHAAYVSASLFPLLAIQPLQGRAFTRAEDAAAGPPVVLISERLWRARFYAGRDVVGSGIRVSGELRTIVGIMPNSFAFPPFAELWLPLAPLAERETRADRAVGVVARLADGASLESARTEIGGLAVQNARAYPATNQGWTAHVMPLRAELTADYLPSFYVMLGIVAFVLLVACANLANLLLARASARRQELAVRVALGASRLVLARHVLIESLLLSGVAGALGLLMAWWSLAALTAVTSGALPPWVRYGIDLRVISFATSLALVTGVLFGLLPALQVAATDVNASLMDGGRAATAGRPRTRVRNTLVAVQIAAALALVFGAVFLTRHFLRANQFDPGYSLDGLYGGQLTLPALQYGDARARNTAADAIVERVRVATAAHHVALSSIFIPNWPGTPPAEMRTPGRTPADVAAALTRIVNVTPAYFETHGIKTVSGRDFAAGDVAGAPPVAIIGSALASRLWPGESPLGRQLHLGGSNDGWTTIVGVVPSARTSPFATDTARLLYLPLAQRGLTQPASAQLGLHIRLAQHVEGVPQQVRAAIAAIDPDIVVENIASARQSHAAWLAPVRLTAQLVSALGLVAVLLAVLGIYGLIAYTVSQRIPEIGLRIALGASHLNIIRLVLRQALFLAAAGIMAGGFIAFGLNRILQSQFVGARNSWFMVLLLAPAFLLVAALAGWLPARRAARTDPMHTLRNG